MIWIVIFLFSSYAILIVALAIGFLKIDKFIPKHKTPTTHFSIIIPFRNERENLVDLLESIGGLKYPKNLVEFIFVDDDSNDNSVEIIEDFVKTTSEKVQENFTINIIQNQRTSNSPKKDAISTAIATAKNNWIISTDADCIIPKNWLLNFDSFIQEKQPKMVVAPVNYQTKDNLLEQFQLLDFMSLQGSTIGGFGIDFPFLCNGANLGYRKDIFIKLNGFDGNNTIASGDDIFLFEKFLEDDKKSVQFLKSKDAMVTTFPVKTFNALIQQRMRWASKTSNIKSAKVKLLGLLVFIVNLTVVLSLFIANHLTEILLPIVVKITVDVFLFLPTIRFYGHQKTFFKWYLFCSFLYPFFNVFIVFKALFFKYSWKGRSFKI